MTDAGATEIVVDFTRWSRPGFGAGDPITGSISRAVLDPHAGTVAIEDFSDESAEFSRIDDRMIGQPHRHFVATNKTGDLPVGEQNTLVRVDTATGSLERWVSGNSVFDEVIFVPAPGGGPEQGFYVTFRTDRTDAHERLRGAGGRRHHGRPDRPHPPAVPGACRSARQLVPVDIARSRPELAPDLDRIFAAASGDVAR